MDWTVVLLPEVQAWFATLEESDPSTAASVASTLDLLASRGPALGRPMADTLQGSSLPNLKELRPPSRGRSEIRILFIFDPKRRAILLTAGDKAGLWTRWYQEHIPVAEQRYADFLAGKYPQED